MPGGGAVRKQPAGHLVDRCVAVRKVDHTGTRTRCVHQRAAATGAAGVDAVDEHRAEVFDREGGAGPARKRRLVELGDRAVAGRRGNVGFVVGIRIDVEEGRVAGAGLEVREACER